MIDAVKQFMKDQFSELKLPDDSTPYTEDKVFFGKMNRNFLKDNKYGVNCFFLQDRKKKDGSIISEERDLEAKKIIYNRKIYERKILTRSLIYAEFDELWSLCDQLESNIVAGLRNIPDSKNNNIKINLQDLTRPWDADRKEDRLKRHSSCAIVRVEFEGGIYKTESVGLIKGLAEIKL
ncbi:MAG: hypothetical protein GY714_10465 [Desulfobacterales bacterium]|nr:hypothetical protein [Desulfobacterales bacterium]